MLWGVGFFFCIMIDEDCVYLTQCCNVRGLSKTLYNVLVDVSLKLNVLRNCAVDKTYLFKSSGGVHYEKINFKPIIKKVKQEFSEEYKCIRGYLANSAICKHVDSFNAYVALKNKSIDKEKIMGIDLGVNNFATIVTTEGTPYTVDGKFLKNQIYFKCKKVAHYQSILDKQGLKLSKLIKNINKRFKGIQNNFLNQTTKFIIGSCKLHNIGTIILGYNKNFQYKSNIGSKQNQIFTHIVFKRFQEKLENKCQKHEIKLIIQEESYTSKSSFLDNDILLIYTKEKQETYEFKGKRIKRGLYKTQNGILINVDVNAAANIIRKSKQKFCKERLYNWARDCPN